MLCHRRFGVYGLSFMRADDEPAVDQLARTRLNAYAVLSVFAAGALRAAGLELRPTFHRPHYTLVLGELEEGLARLAACEHESRENGYYGQADRPREDGQP